MANRGMGYLSWTGQMLGPRKEQQDVALVERCVGALVLGVFDGMGGHQDGLGAAQTAARRVQREVRNGSLERSRSIGAWLQRVLSLAQSDVRDHSRGGTTATVAVLTSQRAVWGWAGDSPSGWLSREGVVQRVTRPHGIGNSVFNGLGRMFEGQFHVEIARSEIDSSATIWVASDGLNPALERPDIGSTLRRWMKIGGKGWGTNLDGWPRLQIPLVDNTTLVMGWPEPPPISSARRA